MPPSSEVLLGDSCCHPLWVPRAVSVRTLHIPGEPTTSDDHHRWMKVRTFQHQLGEAWTPVLPQSSQWGSWVLPCAASELSFSIIWAGFPSLPRSKGLIPRVAPHKYSECSTPLRINFPGSPACTTQPLCCSTHRTFPAFRFLFLIIKHFPEEIQREKWADGNGGDHCVHSTGHRTQKKKQNVTQVPGSPRPQGGGCTDTILSIFWIDINKITQFIDHVTTGFFHSTLNLCNPFMLCVVDFFIAMHYWSCKYVTYHSSTNGYLFLSYLAAMNSTKNVIINVFWWTYICISFDYPIWRELATS